MELESIGDSKELVGWFCELSGRSYATLYFDY